MERVVVSRLKYLGFCVLASMCQFGFGFEVKWLAVIRLKVSGYQVKGYWLLVEGFLVKGYKVLSIL